MTYHFERQVDKRSTVWADIERRMERPDTWFLTADLGLELLTTLKLRYPDRVLNVGIREQHMVAMAIGLARGGKWVICYGIGHHLMRAFEQIHFARYNHVQHLITLVGVGHGGSYTNDGPSHDSDALGYVYQNLPVEYVYSR